MIEVICGYGDWFIYKNLCEMYEGIFVVNQEECTVSELKEVFRIEFSDYETKSIEEILEACPYDYDISGELDDMSAYVYWKKI